MNGARNKIGLKCWSELTRAAISQMVEPFERTESMGESQRQRVGQWYPSWCAILQEGKNWSCALRFFKHCNTWIALLVSLFSFDT